MSRITLVKKICMLGDAAVGKTSLIRRYVHDIFDDSYITTIGTKITRKEMIIRKPRDNISYHLKLMIWDVLGQHSFTNVKTAAYTGAAGAMLVCDTTRKETLEHAKNWAKTLIRTAGEVPVVLLANKSDLPDAAFTDKDIKSVAKELDAFFTYTSAKTGNNVNKAFIALGEALIESPTLKKPLAKPQMAKERKMKPTCLTILDEIIDDFCSKHGGQERAMPIIQVQIDRIGMNFLDPSIEDLIKLVKSLTSIMEFYDAPEDARVERKRYLSIIDQIR